ncbi:MAG TPA: nucleotidyltransferase family protein [Candidatus Acidoferrales bacterium]|nr:nucleotidyltransferase family protein [Candidatus Acidoferrales bacterium]
MLPVAILAGGLATRLHPATEKIPKSLLEVNGEPFVAHQLRLLHANGVRRVVLCAGHLGEMIRNALEDGGAYGVEVDYSFDGATLLGTAGAVKNALPKLGDEFLVLYGDSYLVCDYAAVARGFAGSGKLGLMTVFRNDGKWDASNVEFDGERILAYSKTAKSTRMNYIDYGLGAFRAAAFDGIQEAGAYDLADLYGDLLRQQQLAGFEVTQRFYEIGSAAGLEETSRYLAAQGVARK